MKFSKQKAKEIVKILRNTYPDATCSLDFSTPFEAVVAGKTIDEVKAMVVEEVIHHLANDSKTKQQKEVFHFVARILAPLGNRKGEEGHR